MNSLKQGFTLVELMIVIAIIGILATALYPTVTTYIGRARDSTRLTDLSTISRALQIYKNEYDVYPIADMNFDGEDRGDFHFIEESYAAPIQVVINPKCISYASNPKFLEILPSVPKDPSKVNAFPCADSNSKGSYGFGTGTTANGTVNIILSAQLETETQANVGYNEMQTALVSNNLISLQNKKKGDYIDTVGDTPYFVMYR